MSGNSFIEMVQSTNLWDSNFFAMGFRFDLSWDRGVVGTVKKIDEDDLISMVFKERLPGLR
jgi:hypothetical protein